MPTQQDFDALVKRLDALATRLEAIEAENAALRTEISEERAARQALEEQLRQSRYEERLRITLQKYKLSINRSCRKDYLRYRPNYFSWCGIFNQPQATGVYGPPSADIVADPSRQAVSGRAPLNWPLNIIRIVFFRYSISTSFRRNCSRRWSSTEIDIILPIILNR